MLHTTIQRLSCRLKGICISYSFIIKSASLPELTSICAVKRNMSSNCTTGPKKKMGARYRACDKPLSISHFHMEYMRHRHSARFESMTRLLTYISLQR